MKSFIKLLFILTFTISYSNEKQYQVIEDQANLPKPITERETIKIRLNNGLNVYIISDSKAEKSAASLSVKVGSWNDPKEYPGMAHFLEHMLFKGTKAYPDPSEYFRFIFDNAGSANAFTAPHKTVYTFSINNDVFSTMLDRFAHFFIDPTFDTSEINKELYVIDQEHAKNIENDYWRLYQTSKEIGNPNHPNALFSTGNANTLSEVPHEIMKQWYEKNYSSNLMTLVVYSNLPLQNLIDEIVNKFKDVPNHALDELNISEKLFSENQKGHFTYIKPIKNLQKLYLEWELPSKYTQDLTKSTQLIAYTLNQAQENSLKTYLKKEGFIENLHVEAEEISNLHALFSIDIDLTDKGLNEINYLIQIIFDSLKNIKNSNIPSYIFYEKNTMAKLNYIYQPRVNPFNYVEQLASKLTDENLNTFPLHTVFASEYAPKTINDVLSALTPQSCCYYLLVDPHKIGITPDKKEKWMGVEYKKIKIPESLLISWNEARANTNITIPSPNPFIPSDLKLILQTKDDISPKKIVNSENGTTFFYPTTKYDIPEIVHIINIKTPSFDGTQNSTVLKELYIKTLQDHLEPLLTTARYAGLHADFSIYPYSIELHIIGYSEKAQLLLQEIYKKIKSFSPCETTFNLHKNILSKNYDNTSKDLPCFQAIDYTYHAITKPYFTPKQKLEELKDITYANFERFNKELFHQTYVEAFLGGNLTIQDAESVWLDTQDVLGGLPFFKKDQKKLEAINLSSKNGPYKITKQVSAKGTGVVLGIETLPYSLKAKCLLQILSSTLKEAFFTELRSKQKTGYIVMSTDKDIEKHLFQLFLVQSNTHNGEDLILRFENFIEDYQNNLSNNVSEERFSNVKNSLIKELEFPDINLISLIQKLDNLAFHENENFSYIKEQISTLKSLSYEDFLTFSNTILSKNNKKRLAIIFKGQIEEGNSYKEITYDTLIDNNEFSNKNS